MPDWTSSMQQTFEFYVVDPSTWGDQRKLDNIISCSIERDSSADTLGSASFETTEPIGECYIRCYLVTIQNGLRERHPLGTFLVQTPSTSFDGMVRSISVDAYTPLIELKENPPPIGYSILKGSNIMERTYELCSEHMRAPVVPATSSETLLEDSVAELNDTWLSFTTYLANSARFDLDLDEMGTLMFAPRIELDAMQPRWTYNDDNSSILYPDFTLDQDLYGIPNIVEVVYSSGNGQTIYARSVNDDDNSPTSISSRGREIVHRVTDLNIGNPNAIQVQQHADQLLRELSSLEYTVNYTHGYCPVRVGDCVRLNYSRAGLENVNARVTQQSISLEPGCPVSETAVFSTKLWR